MTFGRYLAYGEPEWRAQATAALEKMECFDPQTKVEFQQTLAWLHEHAVRAMIYCHIFEITHYI